MSGSILTGVITNQGLEESIAAAANNGWYIYPTGFGISSVLGIISQNRSMDDLNPMWYEALISSRAVKDTSTIEFICTIPPGASAIIQEVKEIYLFATNEDGEKFLLSISGIEGIVSYDPSGSLKLRIQISIQNLDLKNLYVFKYTQANEITDHNIDPNAHPDIREDIEKLKLEGGGGDASGPSLLYYGNLWA